MGNPYAKELIVSLYMQREHLGILEGKKVGELLAWDDYKRMHFTDSVRPCKMQVFDGCIVSR